MSKRVSRGITMVALLALLAGATEAGERFDAQDQDSRILSDRVNLAVGGYAVAFSTTASFGIGGVLGTFVRLENQLKLTEDQQDVFLDGFYRITPKKTLQFTVLQLQRDATTAISEEFTWDGRDFALGALVDSEFDSTLFKLVYSYSFINNGKVNAGVAAGLSFYKYKLALSGIATFVNDMGAQVTEFQEVGEDLLIPLPTVGFFIDYAIMRKLIFRARVDFLDLSVGDLSGRLIDSKLTLDWYFNKNIGIGLGTAGTSLQVENLGDDPWDVSYRYSGLQFYVSGVF